MHTFGFSTWGFSRPSEVTGRAREGNYERAQPPRDRDKTRERGNELHGPHHFTNKEESRNVCFCWVRKVTSFNVFFFFFSLFLSLKWEKEYLPWIYLGNIFHLFVFKQCHRLLEKVKVRMREKLALPNDLRPSKRGKCKTEEHPGESKVGIMRKTMMGEVFFRKS